MNIKCDYCEKVFQDTLAACPYCGGTNNRVVRTAKDQPLTIEDLQKWYQEKKLPPYETTRFFIGQNVNFPRAFGIYQNGQNFIVYKNKADGTRAIRYEGEDEAYAVNEIFQRLKQEILQQKSSGIRSSANASAKNGTRKRRPNLKLVIFFVVAFGLQIFAVIGLLIHNAIYSGDYIEDGYYQSEGRYYYYDDEANWFFEAKIDDRFDTLEENCVWTVLYDTPKPLQYHRLNKRSKLKRIYIGKDYDDALRSAGVEDFKKSLDYQDYLNGNHVDKGYYSFEDTTYYHISDYMEDDWYYYDTSYDDWYSISYYALPVELRHYETSDDFYVTEYWDESTQVTDFTTTDFYEDWQEQQEQIRYSDSYDYDDDSYDSYDNSYDSDYDWDSGSDWDSGWSDWDSDW